MSKLGKIVIYRNAPAIVTKVDGDKLHLTVFETADFVRLKDVPRSQVQETEIMATDPAPPSPQKLDDAAQDSGADNAEDNGFESEDPGPEPI